jgi:histidyl-tRNA synthetase
MTKVTPRRPSGFPEYTPAEQIVFNGMLATIRQSYETAGFGPIETPALELAEVLLAKGGGETEQEVFRFEKGSKDYVMHYDLTVPMARYVAEHQNDLVFPFRRSQIQKVWRAERTQKGRSREFYQCDADVIGETDVAIDGEVIGLAAATIRALNVGAFTIHINNRKLLTGLYEELNVTDQSTALLRIIDKLEKIGEATVREEMAKIGLDGEAADMLLSMAKLSGPVDEVLSKLRAFGVTNNTYIRGLEELERAIEAAQASGVAEGELVIDCSIARGLDYYTSTVFETVINDMLDLGSVCSGGRYNDLASYYTDRSLPGVGISVGITRLFDGLKSLGRLDLSRQSTSQAIVLALDESAWGAVGELGVKLRAAGVSCELALADTKPAKVFARADKLNIPYVLIIGEKERAAGTVAIKDMRSGEQTDLGVSEVLKKLSN